MNNRAVNNNPCPDHPRIHVYDRGDVLGIMGRHFYGTFRVVRIIKKGITLAPVSPENSHLIQKGEALQIAGGSYKVVKFKNSLIIARPRGKTTKKLYADAFR